MAFWNAPIDVPSHAQKAILAAYDMRDELKRVNAALKDAARNDRPEVELRIGMGLNSGIAASATWARSSGWNIRCRATR
jgi:adenylate cyclase